MAETTTEAVKSATKSVDMADKDILGVAFDAIENVTNLATYTLTVLGILIALIAVFGWWEMRRHSASTAESVAKRVANKRLDDYLKSEEIGDRVLAAVQEQAEKRVAGMIVVTPPAPNAADVGGEAFPEAPEGEEQP